ncbi:hypothetical protein Tco_0356873 [Tanacetum coccineum]
MQVQDKIIKEAEPINDEDEFVDSGIHSLGNVTFEEIVDSYKADQEALESPFDIEYEILVVKRFQPSQKPFETKFHMEIDESEDSDQHSMPDDEVQSISGFEATDSNEETTIDNIIDEVTNLQASADKPSDPLGHLQAEITSLSTKVDQLESSITNKVSEEIQSSVQTIIVDALKEQLSGFLSKHVRDLRVMFKDMVNLLEAVEVFKKTNAEGEKWEKNNPEQPEVTQPEDAADAQGEQKSIFPEPTPIDPTPPRNESKGKGIVIEEDPLKDLMPYIEEGGSRLADLKAKNEKSDESLKKIMNPANIQAQAQKIAEYEAKRAKMLAEYNHYITFRANQRRITRINYKIDRVNKDATMRIKRDNQPLSLTVFEKFRLKQLGFSEWIKVQALASKGKGKAIDTLLKNLKAKFEWIKAQARKLGLPLPSELLAFGLTPAEKKRKRASEILDEVFVKEDIRVDGMHRNLIPFKELLVFQREEEFHLATTTQLIRLYSGIQRNTPEAEEMYKKLEYTIEARNDANQARIIRVTKGLAECKASASNLGGIQVKDIIKEVEDYLKTYLSAEMDIRWYVEGIL